MNPPNETPEPDEAAGQTIVIDSILDEPPHQVWRALTDPQLLAEWLMPNDIRAEVGRLFTFQDEAGAVVCEVLKVEPDKSISYTWRDEREAGDKALESVVTWTLEPAGDGKTRLRLVHDDFALSDYGTLVVAIGTRRMGRMLARRRLAIFCMA